MVELRTKKMRELKELLRELVEQGRGVCSGALIVRYGGTDIGLK